MNLAMVNRRDWRVPILGLLLFPLVGLLAAPSEGVEKHRGPSAEGSNGMVVSVSAPASEVGVDVLRRGGTAVDASVAVAFALAVTWPAAGNIGGGGFMLVSPGGN